MTAHRLPVSGLEVVLQLPTGAEDVLLVEAGAPSMAVALALLDRVVHRLDGGAIEWAALSPTDVDVLLLVLRRRVIGDVIIADVRCAAPRCHARVDISFSITGFLDHHRPSRPDNVVAAADDGWLRIGDGEVEFRLPRAVDQLAVALDPEPELALVRRCIRPEPASDAIRDDVEAAMEALAPSMFSELEGACPECGATVRATFDPLQYTLRELRDGAAYVYHEVLAIARHTHWAEADILALPTARRARYAELVQEPAVA